MLCCKLCIFIIQPPLFNYMTAPEITIAFIIYLLVPFAGLMYYLRLYRLMKVENIPNAPAVGLFIIFATYGGLLLLALTSFGGVWSGLASIGTFYLLMVAPFIMSFITYRQRHTKAVSKYHKLTYLSALFYFIVAPVVFILLFLFGKSQ